MPVSLSRVGELLAQYQDVVNPGKSLPPAVHDVVHHTVTSRLPLVSKFFHTAW